MSAIKKLKDKLFKTYKKYLAKLFLSLKELIILLIEAQIKKEILPSGYQNISQKMLK
jgi:hypothetical protein